MVLARVRREKILLRVAYSHSCFVETNGDDSSGGWDC